MDKHFSKEKVHTALYSIFRITAVIIIIVYAPEKHSFDIFFLSKYIIAI